MKFTAFSLLIFAFLDLKLLSGTEIQSSIVNGEDASIQEFPHMAKVWIALYPMCGGSILNSRCILTAAHCFVEALMQPGIISAVVGSSYRDGRLGGRRYRALRTFIHPNYVLNETTLTNDVAVMRTISEINFNRRVQPIKLHQGGNLGIGVKGIFTVWGFVDQGLILPTWADRLQKMEGVTISNQECYARLSWHTRGQWLSEQNVCVASGLGTSVCGGDSGGGFLVENQVAAVVSWRVRECGDGTPDVFVRISDVRDWIVSVM